jgi:hypothetical protein
MLASFGFLTFVPVTDADLCDATATYCTDIQLPSTAQLTKFGTASIMFRPGVRSHSYMAVFAAASNDTSDDAGSTSSTVTLTVRVAVANAKRIVQP